MNGDGGSDMIRLQILFADPGSLHMCLYHCAGTVFSSGLHLQNMYVNNESGKGLLVDESLTPSLAQVTCY